MPGVVILQEKKPKRHIDANHMLSIIQATSSLLGQLVDGVLLLLGHDLSNPCELFLGQLERVGESLLSPLLLQLGKRSRDQASEVLLVLCGAVLGLLCGNICWLVAGTEDRVLVSQLVNDGRRHGWLEQVGAVGSFVDCDTKGVVVVALWFVLFLDLGPGESGLDTRKEALALDVFATTVLTLYPSSVAQIDSVQNDVFKVAGGLVAKRKDESEMFPGDGH